MVTDDKYEEIGRLASMRWLDLLFEYAQQTGLGQFSYYRFGLWIERNYPDIFQEYLTGVMRLADEGYLK